MEFQGGRVVGDFPMGVAAVLYILFGLTVMAVIVWLQRSQKQDH